MKNKRILTALILAFFTVFFNSCNNDDDVSNSEEIDIKDAILLEFPLLGITPTSIEIINPIIEDNKETKYGQVNIVVPNNTTLTEIKSFITSNELNLSKFSILPGNNQALSYETQSHVHTIVNTLNENQEWLHYTVTIKKELPPTPPSTLTVTDFKFEASKNAQLTEDVIIEKRENDINKQNIYLFVPEGTDFSSLTPSVIFDAEKVYYTQESNIPIVDVNTPYPTTETTFDFSYPKKFIFVLRDDASNRIKWINVFVDVKNPVQLENSDITTPDIDQVDTPSNFIGITKWKNVGNHKIEFQSATTYENKIPENSINFIVANRVFPPIGLEPGENADINIHVLANLPNREYKTTAIFYTKFVGHNMINDIVSPVKLNITTNIVN